jgi:hypothetical protein
MSSGELAAHRALPSVRDYERSDPIGMMHMNRSDISELCVCKRGELFYRWPYDHPEQL